MTPCILCYTMLYLVLRSGSDADLGQKVFVMASRKKKKSKITQPSKTPNGNLQAFRVDRELALLLKKVPNKSETMVKALREYFSKNHLVTCSHCAGKGKVMKRA